MLGYQSFANYIAKNSAAYGSGSAELVQLLSDLATGAKIIARLLSFGFDGPRFDLRDGWNIDGETGEKLSLDRKADQILMGLLGASNHLGLLVSEVQNRSIATAVGNSEAQFVVAIDPLDGASNIGSSSPVGTIFTVFRKRESGRPAIIGDFYQRGQDIVVAGYFVYGSKTSLVCSFGHGVQGFCLDRGVGEFVLSEEAIRMPERGPWYSVNEGYSSSWNRKILDYVSALKDPDSDVGLHMSRYVGSLVVDFDRILREGGVLLHPENKSRPAGKIRLLYECLPLAFIAEHAGGRAIDGSRNILNIIPRDINERSPILVGSSHEINSFEEMQPAQMRNAV